ncbi:hypothetical protein BH09ACT10_BH09ACT10_25590 [soil metagenome]
MRGIVATLNPLVLLSFGLMSLVGSLAVRTLPIALVTIGGYTLAALIFLPTWRYPLACLAICSIAALSIVYSTWRLGGHDEKEALTAGLRIVILAWPGSVMAGFVDPTRLADYLAQTLKVPARFAAALSAALQRFAAFGSTWQQLDRARRARGFAPGRNPVTMTAYAAGMSFALLIDALRGASQSSIAMDARGFATAHHRTWAEPASWPPRDLVGLAVAVGLASIPIILYVAQ